MPSESAEVVAQPRSARWTPILVVVVQLSLSQAISLLFLLFPPVHHPTFALAVAIVLFFGALAAVWRLAWYVSPVYREWWIRRLVRRSTMQTVGISLAVLTVAIGTIGVVWRWRVVVVPDLVGKGQAVAAAEAQRLGLLFDPLRAADSDDDTPITHQEPLAGTERMQGSVLSVVVGVLRIEVAITDPVDGATVSQKYTVMGKSKGVVESRGRLHANLLLHPLNATGYWVYGPLTVDREGNWRNRVYFGVPGGPPEDFELVAVVSRGVLKAEGSGDGRPEYEAVPPYISISNSVVVTRK